MKIGDQITFVVSLCKGVITDIRQKPCDRFELEYLIKPPFQLLTAKGTWVDKELIE